MLSPATHYLRCAGAIRPVCGTPHDVDTTTDRAKVTCVRCRGTFSYRHPRPAGPLAGGNPLTRPGPGSEPDRPGRTVRQWAPEDYRRNAWAEQDPELLGSQDLIRYGEQLIRREHRATDDDALFWLPLAAELHHLAGIPDRTGRRQDWAEFNRARDIALGYLRRSKASPELRAELLRFYAPAAGQPGS